MTEARITRPRRIFVEYMGGIEKTTFSHLRKNLVGKGESKMDITTLYRMIEVFKEQGLIHEVEKNGERHIFLAGPDFIPEHDAVNICVCENCGHIETKYSPLPDEVISSIAYSKVETCKNCPQT